MHTSEKLADASQVSMRGADLTTILECEFHAGPWAITRPRDGMSMKMSFVAAHGERRVFLKFDVAAPAVARLGELGVAPALLALGIAGGRPYII
jgi:hypothetical protein